MKSIRIVLPVQVNRIIHTLQAHGFEAYAVGGCVRDSVLGRIPDDWDITTSAMPEETKALFARTVDTGIEHGTITVLMEGEGFEVTTYRIDGKYEDGRHPSEVTFTRSLQEDLLRRDFTINAMAYNDKEGLVDIFGGMEDLEAKTICCVGDAYARFSEDALRILRGVRFAAQLGFDLEEETREAMRELAPTLQKISAERIRVELVKMLVSKRPELLREAYELGITKEFLPEFDLLMETTQENPHHAYTVGEHTLRGICNVRSDKVLRLAMLLHDIAKPLCKTFDERGVAHFYNHAEQGEETARVILRRLKFDNDTVKKVTTLVRYHDLWLEPKGRNVRRAVNRMGKELFPYYLEVRHADILAQSTFEREKKLENLERTKQIFEEVLEREDAVAIKDLAVTGSDLIAAGMKPGKEIGEVLNHLLEMVLENPDLNHKEELLGVLRMQK